jgi:polyisoprenoid-binding protein YceI
MAGRRNIVPERSMRARAALVLCMFAPWTAPASPARFELDPVHTRVLVSIGHGGYSEAMGTVSGSEGTLVFDPDDWSVARLEVEVPLERLDFGDAGWNAAVQRMLGTDRHPVARFVAEDAEPVDDGTARVCGRLTLRGTTRRLCMQVRANRLARHSMPPFRLTAGFSATTTLMRSDFGIDDWPRLVGDEVTLRIEAEARHAGPVAMDAGAVQDAVDGDGDGDGPTP